MTNIKCTLFLFLLSTISTVMAQSYIDIAKVSYSNVSNVGFENSNTETNLTLFNASLTAPIPISEKTAFITGIDVIYQELDLFPTQFSRSIAGLTLKAGLSIKHNDKWSGTYMLLPKIASEDLSIDGDTFFLGGIALLKFQKSERMQYRFGVYASDEAFGILVTPLIGLYYKNEASYWEATLNLPINGDVNYSINDRFKVGAAFEAPVRSYVLDTNGAQDQYVQSNVIEVGPYFEHAITKSILLKVQTGYTSVDYQVYAEGDTLPFRLAAFEFGDDRTRLNPEMNGNFFVKASATYRFDIPNKEEVVE